MSDEQPTTAETVKDEEFALVAAAFTTEAAAVDAANTIKNTEDAGDIEVEGVLAVKVDDAGNLSIIEMTDYSTKTGVKWGVVGGIVLGVIFPPSLIAGAVAGGALGGVMGKLRNTHHRSQVSKQIQDALPNGSAGILALVRAEDAETVTRSLPAATKVTTAPIDADAAKDIREAASQVS